jgi:hypothetical protein
VDAVALLVRCPQLLEQLSVVLAWSSEEARDAALQQLVSFLVQLTPFVAVRGHMGGVVGDEGSVTVRKGWVGNGSDMDRQNGSSFATCDGYTGNAFWFGFLVLPVFMVLYAL